MCTAVIHCYNVVTFFVTRCSWIICYLGLCLIYYLCRSKTCDNYIAADHFINHRVRSPGNHQCM